MTDKETRESLLEALVIKSNVKQTVFANTAQTFLILKKVLQKLEKNYVEKLENKKESSLGESFPVEHLEGEAPIAGEQPVTDIESTQSFKEKANEKSQMEKEVKELLLKKKVPENHILIYKEK